MVSVCARCLITSLHPQHPAKLSLPAKFSSVNIFKGYSDDPSSKGRFDKQSRRSQLLICCKGSSYQDGEILIKPVRLLRAVDMKILGKIVPEETFATLDESESFYMVELCTSRESRSSLRDVNAAILISLIDSNGTSLLQRVAAAPCDYNIQEEKDDSSPAVHFQRGSVDIVVFKGPKLAKVEALWVGLESGSWRLNGISLTVLNGASKQNYATPDICFEGLQYIFEERNLPLGDGGQSMAELKPVVVSELPAITLSDLLSMQAASYANSTSYNEELKEEGLREYSELKTSLLLYDLAIVFAGSGTLVVSSNERAGYSFLVGGAAGFIYLLLLQRSVDGLPVPVALASKDHTESTLPGFDKNRTPGIILVLMVAISLVLVKYGSAGVGFELTPIDLFLGASGFLASKAAVLLAAFRPLRGGSTEDKV